jgi:hypothetical protein
MPELRIMWVIQSIRWFLKTKRHTEKANRELSSRRRGQKTADRSGNPPQNSRNNFTGQYNKEIDSQRTTLISDTTEKLRENALRRSKDLNDKLP